MKIGDYVIVRTFSAGVHTGTLAEKNGREVTLSNSRRIWFWRGAFSLSEIALRGVGEGSKISVVAPEITLTEAIEIIPATAAAQENLEKFQAYQP